MSFNIQQLPAKIRDARNYSHQDLVQYIKKTIESYGLLTFGAHGTFSQGFIPDVITNVDGTQKGWVVIDVINSKESLLRDIAGLLVVKANVEAKGDKIKALLGAVSNNVESVRDVSVFLRQHPELILFHIEEFPIFLADIIAVANPEEIEEAG